MTRFVCTRPWISAPFSLLILMSGACSLDGLSQNILLDTVENSEGGIAGQACGSAVLPAPVAIPDNSANNSSNLLTVRNVAVDHPLLTPNQDGRHDVTEFNADFVVTNPGVAGRAYHLDWRIRLTNLDSCQNTVIASNSVPVVFPQAPETIVEEFEGLAEGTVLSAQPEGFQMACAEDGRPAACITLDSAGQRAEFAMRSAELGHIVVLAKSVVDQDGDGVVDRPDNASRGGTMVLTFDSPVRLNSLGFKDVDWNEAGTAVVTTASGSSSFGLPRGDNGAQTRLFLGMDDVVSVELNFEGSAALTDVDFTRGSTLSGAAEINVRHLWDGGGLADGHYGFLVEADLRDTVEGVTDGVASLPVAMALTQATVDFDQQPPLGVCDPQLDEGGCQCAETDPTCSVSYLDAVPTPQDFLLLAPTFVVSEVDTEGRYSVTANLDQLDSAGLVFKGDGVWASGAELQAYVTALTGVPASADGRLFNFDFTQVGTSTPVNATGFANYRFNHLILDLITDEDGGITIDGTRVSVAELLNSTDSGIAAYDFAETFAGTECTNNAGLNGSNTLEAKFCAFSDGMELGDGVGLYVFRNSAFDVVADGVPSVERQSFCDGDGCAVRTLRRPLDVTIDGFFYALTQFGLEVVRTDSVFAQAGALSRTLDRGPISAVLSGQCARTFVENPELRVRMDASDGAVGTTCVINGYFE